MLKGFAVAQAWAESSYDVSDVSRGFWPSCQSRPSTWYPKKKKNEKRTKGLAESLLQIHSSISMLMCSFSLRSLGISGRFRKSFMNY